MIYENYVCHNRWFTAWCFFMFVFLFFGYAKKSVCVNDIACCDCSCLFIVQKCVLCPYSAFVSPIFSGLRFPIFFLQCSMFCVPTLSQQEHWCGGQACTVLFLLNMDLLICFKSHASIEGKTFQSTRSCICMPSKNKGRYMQQIALRRQTSKAFRTSTLTVKTVQTVTLGKTNSGGICHGKNMFIIIYIYVCVYIYICIYFFSIPANATTCIQAECPQVHRACARAWRRQAFTA